MHTALILILSFSSYFVRCKYTHEYIRFDKLHASSSHHHLIKHFSSSQTIITSRPENPHKSSRPLFAYFCLRYRAQLNDLH